ncbi:fibrinogen, putative, partial [Ixodes scapularis]
AGTRYDALSYHNGSVFSIKTGSPDRDGCYGALSGGWWFKKCTEANLNGRKLPIVLPTKTLGITWNIKGDMDSYYYPYQKVEMKIRDADFGFCTGRRKF